MYAATMPGKLGDALYSLPILRHIYEQTGQQFDFYTSEYCSPMKELMEYQSCINRCIIADWYKVERFDMGVQPWYIPVNEDKYDRVFQLGFMRGPDRPLHQFIAHEIGYDIPLAVKYDFPDIGRPCGRPYICIAPRGETSFKKLFLDVAEKLIERGIGVAAIGGPGDNIFPENVMNFCDPNPVTMANKIPLNNMLYTTSILSQSSGFVGLMSSQLVLANGFSFPKIAPWDGRSWDMSHVIKQASNHYPIYPTADQVITLLGL